MSATKHGHHEHEKPQHHASGRSRWHVDWRLWIAVVLMLVAIGAYVMTDDESLEPVTPTQQPAAAK